MTAVHAVISSPIGPLTLVADGGALTAVYMENHKHGPAGSLGAAVLLAGSASDTVIAGDMDDDAGVLARTQVQLGEYFAGERREFDLPLAPVGHPFRQRVWSLLREISYGQTRSYGELARQLGDRNGRPVLTISSGFRRRQVLPGSKALPYGFPRKGIQVILPMVQQ